MRQITPWEESVEPMSFFFMNHLNILCMKTRNIRQKPSLAPYSTESFTSHLQPTAPDVLGYIARRAHSSQLTAHSSQLPSIPRHPQSKGLIKKAYLEVYSYLAINAAVFV